MWIAITFLSFVLGAFPVADAIDGRSLINKWLSNSNNAEGAPLAAAQDGLQRRIQDELCSCSPRAYDFRLDFSAGCDDDTLTQGAGLDGSICFFTKGGSPDDVSDIDFPGKRSSYRLFEPKKVDDGRRGLRSNNESSGVKSLLEKASLSSHHKHAANQRQRITQASFDTEPTVITSVTFLEFDSSKNDIINQDSTYFDTELADASVIRYKSISDELDVDVALGDQLELLPGGVMLVLFGVNKGNVVVQNTVAWAYYTLDDCNGVPIGTDDQIGWTTVDSYTPPRNAFCPAVTDMPTSNPTASPVASVVTASPVSVPTPDSKSAKVLGKSSKSGTVDPKASKVFAKGNKSSVDTKSGKSQAEEGESPSQSPKSTKVLGGKSKKGGVMADPKANKETSSKGSKSAVGDEEAVPSKESAKSAKSAKSKTAKKGKSSKASGHAPVSAPAAETPAMSLSPSSPGVSTARTLPPTEVVTRSPVG